jgi:hypothetical protein
MSKMAVVTIGSSSWPIRIGDNATPGQGDYEWYFTADAIRGPWQFNPLSDTTGVTAKLAGVSTWDAVLKHSWTFQGIKTITTKTDYENLLKAIVFWQKIIASTDSRLYLTCNWTDSGGSSCNLAQMVAYTALGLSALRGMVRYLEPQCNDGSTLIFTVVFQWYNYGGVT